jgi:penicillin-binding protein 1B
VGLRVLAALVAAASAAWLSGGTVAVPKAPVAAAPSRPSLPTLVAARVPARVYARPTRLAPGDDLRALDLPGSLEALGYRRVSDPERVRAGTYHLGERRHRVGRRAFRFAGGDDPGGTLELELDAAHRVEALRDAKGAALEEAWLEPELIGRIYGGMRRNQATVTLEDVPPHLLTAVLQVEDQRFYEHSGIDFWRIFGALFANLRAGRIEQGGSTITQQLVRSFFLSNERTLERKLREARMALQIERELSKREILESYLNEVYLGQRGGTAIHGFAAAARHYFDKPLAEIDLAEAALLAGVIRGPSLYDPFRSPARARARRAAVLHLLHERGEIDTDQLATAIGAPLPERPPPAPPESFGYVVEAVHGVLEAWLGEAELGGLEVYTGVDSGIQRAAERAVRTGLEELEREHPELVQDAPLQAALVVLDPQSGEVRALIGGRGHRRFPFNRALAARRQPGSLFKPVVALAAVRREGAAPSYTLASLIEDAPLRMNAGGELWEPANYDHSFRGEVTLRTALEKSLNLPFVHLGRALGPRRIVRTARNLGIESTLPQVASLPLGSGEVTLLEMTRAYGVLAADGWRRPSRILLAVRRGGERLESEAPAAARAFTVEEAFLLTSALRGVVTRGTAARLHRYGLKTPVAGKTGTTDDYRDGWFVGYSPRLVAGVWVGFDDRRRSIGLTGGRSALPIFAHFVNEMPSTGLGFPVPRGIETLEIDPRSGLRATPACPGRTEYFLTGTAPEEACLPPDFDPYRYWEMLERQRGEE